MTIPKRAIQAVIRAIFEKKNYTFNLAILETPLFPGIYYKLNSKFCENLS